MSVITVNGVDVIEGDIQLPLNGVGTADLIVDQPDGTGFAAGTQVKIEGEILSLVGVVAADRSGDYLDTIHIRVLLGAGGMGKTATPRSYVQPGAFVSDVIKGLCADSGETLSVTADAGFLNTNLSAWAVMSGPVSVALGTLISFIAPEMNWRFLSDGSLWIGAETWPSSTVTTDTISQNPADQSFDLGVEGPSIMPGVSIDGIGNIARVEHVIKADAIRTHVWLSAEADRGFSAASQRLARAGIPGIDYLGFYDAKVIAQSDNGSTVDLQPLDKRLGGFGRVPLRLGLPSCVAKFAAGTILRLGWDSGDPRKPFAALFQGAETITDLEIGTAPDNVATVADLTALKTAIGTMASTGNSGGSLTWVAPSTPGSSIVKVQR